MNSKSKSLSPNFNLLKFVVQCFRSWRLFVASVLACVVLAGVFSVFQSPKSQVMAQLLLKDDISAGGSMMLGEIARSFSLGDMFGGSSSTDNEALVLSSHAVMIGTVKDLGLNTSYFSRRFGIKWEQMPLNSPFRLVAPAERADTISASLVFRVKRLADDRIDVKVKKKRDVIAQADGLALPATISTPYGDFIIEKTPFFDTDKGSSFMFQYCSYSAAAQSLMKMVKIYVPDRKTDFIDLSLVTSDPKFGIMVLDRIIDNYVDVSNIYKQGRTTQTLKLVDDRLATLSDEMFASEANLEKFKTVNKLTDVEVDAQYLISKTGSLEASLLEAQTNYELLKLTKDFISNPENKYSLIPELISSGANGQDNGQIATYNRMILERMELLNSAKSNSATVRQLNEQIDAMRDNIVSSVDRMYVNASVALRDIKKEDGRTKSRISELPALERQYVILKRDNMLLEQMYLFLLQQREELNMNINATSYPAQVVDAPYVLSQQPGLTRMLLLVLGAFIGFVLAAIYVFLFKMKKTPVISASEINSILDVPGLDPIHTDKDASAALAIVGEGVNSEAFRQLRSDVQFALKSCEGKAVAVTSMNDSEGKTYIAVNLAASLAAIGKRTLLIDASLRAPKVAACLGISNPASVLSDYVLSSAKPSDIGIVHVGVGGVRPLDVITASGNVVNASDIVASDRFSGLVASLKDSYDYIIIDSSSVKGFSDIYHVTDAVDMTLIVCRINMATPKDIERINSLYSDGRLKRMVVVENDVKN